MVVEGWSADELGIALAGGATPDVPVAASPFVDDFKPLDTKPNETGIQVDYDDLHNLLTDSGKIEPRPGIFYGSAGNDRIQGLTGTDYLAGKGGGDLEWRLAA